MFFFVGQPGHKYSPTRSINLWIMGYVFRFLSTRFKLGKFLKVSPIPHSAFQRIRTPRPSLERRQALRPVPSPPQAPRPCGPGQLYNPPPPPHPSPRCRGCCRHLVRVTTDPIPRTRIPLSLCSMPFPTQPGLPVRRPCEPRRSNETDASPLSTPSHSPRCPIDGVYFPRRIGWRVQFQKDGIVGQSCLFDRQTDTKEFHSGLKAPPLCLVCRYNQCPQLYFYFY